MGEKIKALLEKQNITTENSDSARELYNQSRYGSLLDDGRVQLSTYEGVYLSEKGKLAVLDGKNKLIPKEKFLRLASSGEKEFLTKYAVFKNLRDSGYIVKTALKFGADFRVYPKGVKPGEDHAKWIVFPVHESKTLTWHEFSAKNRVAHSTKKKLLIAVVDTEGDVSYWEVNWLKP